MRVLILENALQSNAKKNEYGKSCFFYVHVVKEEVLGKRSYMRPMLRYSKGVTPTLFLKKDRKYSYELKLSS